MKSTKNMKNIKSAAIKSKKTVSVKNKTTKSKPKAMKVATKTVRKVKQIKQNVAASSVDTEFEQFLVSEAEKQNNKNNNKQVIAAAVSSRRKEKFVDPHILMKLESARGILRKPNGDDDYSLPTIKQYNQAVKDGRLTGQPIAEK